MKFCKKLNRSFFCVVSESFRVCEVCLAKKLMSQLVHFVSEAFPTFSHCNCIAYLHFCEVFVCAGVSSRYDRMMPGESRV